MTNSRYEVCCSCGELTGRAGAGEDSLYLQDVGPFCEDCYEVCTTYAGIANAQLRQRITELEAEVERLKGANAAARELMATLWNSADDWHGPKASSHYRSELIEKMAVLIDRGDSWPMKRNHD